MSGPKCLRCGAGSEWIQGRVPDEAKAPSESVQAPGSAPDILEEGEAWCNDCHKVIFQLGPWQDICPCGAFLKRSGYDEEEIIKREARNSDLTRGGDNPKT